MLTVLIRWGYDDEIVVFDIGLGDSLQVDLIWDPVLGVRLPWQKQCHFWTG